MHRHNLVQLGTENAVLQILLLVAAMLVRDIGDFASLNVFNLFLHG